MLRPIVQARWIEVGAGGPNHGLNLWIEAGLSEHGGVTKRTEEFSLKHGLKVDGAAQAVVEAQPQCVRRDMLEGGDAVNGMASRELGHDVKSYREVMASISESKRRVAHSCQSAPELVVAHGEFLSRGLG